MVPPPWPRIGIGPAPGIWADAASLGAALRDPVSRKAIRTAVGSDSSTTTLGRKTALNNQPPPRPGRGSVVVFSWIFLKKTLNHLKNTHLQNLPPFPSGNYKELR